MSCGGKQYPVKMGLWGLDWGAETWNMSCTLETGLCLRDEEHTWERKRGDHLGSQAEAAAMALGGVGGVPGSGTLSRGQAGKKHSIKQEVRHCGRDSNREIYTDGEKGKQGWSQNKTTTVPGVFSKIQN